MNHKHIISGLIVLGLLAVGITTVAVNASVTSETVYGSEDGICDGLGPHGQTGQKGMGGNGPMDGTGNHWGSQGPHGDNIRNETCITEG